MSYPYSLSKYEKSALILSNQWIHVLCHKWYNYYICSINHKLNEQCNKSNTSTNIQKNNSSKLCAAVNQGVQCF